MHFSKILQIFGGLVLGCIKTKFCKKICVRQHFSSSTRFASFCTAAISKFSQKIGLKKQQFSWKFSKNFANVAKFAKYCQISKISAWESGRFWKMLQNAYFLAKIGADTAENEQHFAEILPTDALWRRRRSVSAPRPPGSPTSRRRGSWTGPPRRPGGRRDTTADQQNFGKMLLVFGCIGLDFCKKIRVLQHFSKSTRSSTWIFWNLAKF